MDDAVSWRVKISRHGNGYSDALWHSFLSLQLLSLLVFFQGIDADEDPEGMWRVTEPGPMPPPRKGSKLILSATLPGSPLDFFELLLTNESHLFEDVFEQLGNRCDCCGDINKKGQSLSKGVDCTSSMHSSLYGLTLISISCDFGLVTGGSTSRPGRRHLTSGTSVTSSLWPR